MYREINATITDAFTLEADTVEAGYAGESGATELVITAPSGIIGYVAIPMYKSGAGGEWADGTEFAVDSENRCVIPDVSSGELFFRLRLENGDQTIYTSTLRLTVRV